MAVMKIIKKVTNVMVTSASVLADQQLHEPS
jgi:hypothetical protein